LWVSFGTLFEVASLPFQYVQQRLGTLQNLKKKQEHRMLVIPQEETCVAGRVYVNNAASQILLTTFQSKKKNAGSLSPSQPDNELSVLTLLV